MLTKFKLKQEVRAEHIEWLIPFLKNSILQKHFINVSACQRRIFILNSVSLIVLPFRFETVTTE